MKTVYLTNEVKAMKTANNVNELTLDKETLDRLARANLERIRSGQAMAAVQEQAKKEVKSSK